MLYKSQRIQLFFVNVVVIVLISAEIMIHVSYTCDVLLHVCVEMTFFDYILLRHVNKPWQTGLL